MAAKIAYPFSSTKSYSAGELALYDGQLYEFITSHSGAWNDAHVKHYDSTIQNNIERIVSGYNRAVKDVAKVSSFMFAVSQITGTRYKYTFRS